MVRWRTLIYLVLLIAFLWWLYPRTGSGKAGVTEVTIWFTGPTEGRHLDVTDAFEVRFPECKAIIGQAALRGGQVAEGDPQRLMCGVAGGVPPEVVEYDRFAICQWAARGAFRDLTPLIEKDTRDFHEEQRKFADMQQSGADAAAIEAQRQKVEALDKLLIRPDEFYTPTWDECRYRGGQFGIPNYVDDRVLYYNSDLLVAAGLVDEQNRPKPPDTWEQICRKRVDAPAPRIKGLEIACQDVDFHAAGVRPGDTVIVDPDGKLVRCLVESVLDPHRIKVKTAYAAKALRLEDGAKRIKVFDQDGYGLRLSRWSDDGQLRVVGYEPQHGNSWLYIYGWLNGGEFMSEDGRRCTLNDPAIVEALEWTVDVYDSVGGAVEVNAFKKSFQSGVQDPFLLNQVAMMIHGDWFMRDLVRYKRDMNFGTYPPPVPAARIDPSLPPEVREKNRYVTWIGGFAYCIPATCPEEKLDAAWTLVKYLSSLEGAMVMNNHDAQRERAQGRLYMPRLMAHKPLMQLQVESYIDVPEMPERVREAMKTHRDMLPYARYRPITPVGQRLWAAQADAQEAAWVHAGAHGAKYWMDYYARLVQQDLDAFLTPKPGTAIGFAPMVYIYLALLAIAAALVYVRHKRKDASRGYFRREWYAGLAFALPWLVGFVVFSGGPLVFSAIMSLTEYDVVTPPRFIGLDNYAYALSADGDFGGITGVGNAMANTLYMTISVPIAMVAGLALAMLLNLKVRGIAVYRTLFFLPAIMPIVAASILWIWVFNAQNGLLNYALEVTHIDGLLNGLGVKTPISWLTDPDTSKPALIIMIVWGAGASMIIWLAGLKEAPQHLYEAAAIDGAGPFRRFLNITLPMLSPYIFFNLVIGVIATLQVFTQAYIMTPNGSPQRSTYFYVYKLFDECFSFFKLGYGAALAWLLFVVIIVLTLVQMRLSKRWVHYGGI